MVTTPTAYRWLLLALLLCMTAISCKKTQASEGRGMETLSEQERRQKIQDDLMLVRRYDRGLADTIAYAKSRPELFIKDEEIQLTPKQKRELRVIWGTLLDYMRALDGIKIYWKKFHKYNAITERRAHAEAFLVSHSAWIVQYRHGLEFVDLTVPSTPMEKLLDEGSSDFDIPRGAFKSLKWNIIHVKSVTRLMGSSQYFKTVTPALKDADCDRNAWCEWGMERAVNYAGASTQQLKERAAVQFSYNAFDIVRDMSFDAWFPVQKNVAEWMGDTRVRRLHKHLIAPEQLDEIGGRLEPGDILVTRHNWYLSNVGLPGFWPHSELYIGSPEAMSQYFDDPTVRAHFDKEHDAEGLIEHLKAVHPEAWKAFGEDSEHVIIEAVSEGVRFSTIEEGLGADYAAGMRPRRTKLDKAIAVARAFAFWGRPYDFNFDFVTDESLVCTELVYKAWVPHQYSSGLKLELAEVMGRQTLPANDLVRQFDEAYDNDGAMDFVFFLDGREKEGKAVLSTLESLRNSWQRPKWDVMQK